MKLVFLLTSAALALVEGHGFLEDPPYRAYYAGYDTPQGMNCGGISVSFTFKLAGPLLVNIMTACVHIVVI